MPVLFTLAPLSRAGKGIVFGGLIGLAAAAIPPKLSIAQATLFFPPPLVLRPETSADATPQPLPDLPTESPDPLRWAEGILTSKEAVEALCKKIERSAADDKVEVLRSACLLAEEQRVSVTPLENSYLRLSVAAEDPNVSLSLCAGLLAYLTFKTKIPLEDPDSQKLSNAGKQLRVQERGLTKQLWGRLAFDAKPTGDGGKDQSLELDLLDYQGNVANYRRQARVHFFRETRAAAAGPSFVVVEPPYTNIQPRPWLSWGLLGAAAGWLVSRLLRGLQALQGLRRGKGRRNFVPWRAQEAAFPRRSPSAGSPSDPDR